MEDLNAQEPRPRGPRLYHKKSRTGCLRCKQRRVKCDELRPSCSSCSRHLVECVYQAQPPASSDAKATGLAAADLKSLTHPVASVASAGSTAEIVSHRAMGASLGVHPSDLNLVPSPHSSGFYPSPSSSHLTPRTDDTESEMDLPDGSWRRLWELRLLHNSQTRMKRISGSQDPQLEKLWSEDVPNMAISFAQNQGRCSLLYIQMAHSALHMWTFSKDKRERDELIRLQQTYQLMCSKEQRRDIDEIPYANPKLLDYICFTSLRILSHSLALVQTLSLDPWEPPLQWLYMGHGAGTVFRKASNELRPEHNSLMSKFVNSPPVMRDAEEMILGDHSSLAWLLDHPSPPGSMEAQIDQELNDDGTRSVYENALSYTCSVLRAIDQKEPRIAIARRLGGFAVWVPIEFSRFIEQRRPRALVILAHFMSIWLDLEDIWLFGRAGEWQIRCIYKNLPVEWCCKLDGLFAKFKHQNVQR
ncbi:putative c6 transcription protein [Rosellinia necatrix]|uniref:Putative c6 transcription protein n=1 Tax=Rosellinia necatrix TaxID=77044 RepID=A0A1W2TLH7_ROSNE|nr:putative c6 transcription protein [Rosellinia necatrix]